METSRGSAVTGVAWASPVIAIGEAAPANASFSNPQSTPAKVIGFQVNNTPAANYRSQLTSQVTINSVGLPTGTPMVVTIVPSTEFVKVCETTAC